MTSYFLADTAALTGRTLRHVTRSIDTIITTAVMPIAMMLLFVYVFGGAIDTGTVDYIDYMLPGILLITIASGISYTAFRLFTDMQKGIFERFQSMPIARSGLLWAHVVTSLVATTISLVIVIVVGFAMGFRTGAGPLAWLAVVGILVIFTVALTWLAVIPGLTATTIEGASVFAYSADLPAVPQLGVRAHRHDARPGALVRGEPAGDLDRRHDPQAFRRAAGRQRCVGRAGLVCRPARRVLPCGDGDLPEEDALQARGRPMLTIGQLAAYAGVTVRAVRHYHAKGLLPEPIRDPSGYRRYDAAAVVELIRIKTLAEAGVPLLARARPVGRRRGRLRGRDPRH